MNRPSTKGMTTGELSALYPLKEVGIDPFLSLSLLYHTVASQVLLG